MNSDDFRSAVLAMPGTEEGSHMNHPDFRLGGTIFATLGPKLDWGMVKLTPSQQQDFMRRDPAFKPASGKWGEQGSTIVTLADALEAEVLAAIEIAWRNAVAQKPKSKKP
jgi:predicted DNA-binding protein (MmcQ/YjbR family)